MLDGWEVRWYNDNSLSPWSMDCASYDPRSFGDVTSTQSGRIDQEWNCDQVSLFNLMMQTFKRIKKWMIVFIEICYGWVLWRETYLSKWANIYQVVEKENKRESELSYTSVPLIHWTWES